MSIRVVWLCHFRNAEIDSILKPRKYRNEMAPWISFSIKMLEEDSRFELHIVSPYEYIGGNKSFMLRGIYYHFFNAHIPFIGRHWPWFFKFDYWTNFYMTKRKVARIVNKIAPDIVHLQSAENAYFSSAIFPLLGKYPVILTVQGFINHTTKKTSYITRKKCAIERKILSKVSHSFYRTEQMALDILKFNPNMKLYWNTYPNNYDELLSFDYNNIEKQYDIVFFARVTMEKGIVDLFQALNIIQKQKSDVSLCVIGGGDIAYFQNIAKKMGVNEKIIWKGFMPTQREVHNEVAKAKVSVLPTYFDIIPGTILESLSIGIPVVAYDVGSIHEVNKKEEVVSLVQVGDINSLAEAIMRLLHDEDLRKCRSVAGKTVVKNMFIKNNEELKTSLLVGYKSCIDDYRINEGYK